MRRHAHAAHQATRARICRRLHAPAAVSICCTPDAPEGPASWCESARSSALAILCVFCSGVVWLAKESLWGATGTSWSAGTGRILAARRGSGRLVALREARTRPGNRGAMRASADRCYVFCSQPSICGDTGKRNARSVSKVGCRAARVKRRNRRWSVLLLASQKKRRPPLKSAGARSRHGAEQAEDRAPLSHRAEYPVLVVR